MADLISQVETKGMLITDFETPDQAIAWLNNDETSTSLEGTIEGQILEEQANDTNTVAPPVEPQAPVEPETPAQPQEIKLGCPKCSGTGQVEWTNDRLQKTFKGRCFRCVVDPQDEKTGSKGHQTEHDLARNMFRDQKKVGVSWVLTVKALVEGEERTTNRHLASSTEVFVRNDDGTIVAKTAGEIKPHNRIFTPRLVKVKGDNPGDLDRIQTAGLLMAEVLEVVRAKNSPVF